MSINYIQIHTYKLLKVNILIYWFEYFWTKLKTYNKISDIILNDDAKISQFKNTNKIGKLRLGSTLFFNYDIKYIFLMQHKVDALLCLMF